jgi:hypothetical protein
MKNEINRACMAKKKIFTILSIMLSLSVSAVTVNDVAGTFKGNLNIGGQIYPNKEIYILPGTANDAITFVLPDFRYNSAPLGNIVLVNIPMSANGQLTLEDATLYLPAISERATITVVNGLEDGGTTYNSIISSTEAQVLLSIEAPSVPEPIFVLFAGQRTSGNYAITNGGFEGSWSNNEPNGWHSFATATGDYASFVTGNTDQFQQSTEKRPGSTGSYSAFLQSNLVVGAKANGNCTNGQINAGSMTASDANGNYNFSDPSNSGYNTPFVGTPDSMVFWAKYIPADQNPSNSENKARMHTVITTNARYQDPEASNNYSGVKIAEAAINYSATSSMGWQRLSVPFEYSSLDPSTAAYVLVTFTTNQTPGGGTTYSSGGLFNKTYYYDNIYLDDAEMIYNHGLKSLTLNGDAVFFTNGQAQTDQIYSDQDYTIAATSDGKAAQTFIGYDASSYRVYIYVVANNYSQARAYSLYTLQMAEPVKDTEYAYAASTCDNEPYSDELFTNLTESGEYKTVIPNTQGGDSLITLTLTVNKTYAFAAEATMKMNESYEWRGMTYQDLTPGVHLLVDSLKTNAGCDSVYTLKLTVEAIGYLFEESMSVCVNEENDWHGKTLPTATEGTYILYDSLKSIYDQDSVYVMTISVHPIYLFEEEKYVNDADLVWRGQTIQDLPKREEPYLIYDSLTTQYGCDSVYLLRLHVSDIPITYGTYSDECCEGEFILFDGIEYTESFDGDVRVSERNIYGGDSIVHLTITVFPSYFIEEELTIIVGEERSWEYYDLSQFPEGTTDLKAEYWSDDFCDSIRVLHLTVLPLTTALPDTRSDKRVAQKVLYNGRLYIIRKDEKIYDILGNKINK